MKRYAPWLLFVLTIGERWLIWHQMGWWGKLLNDDGYDYLQIAGNLLEGWGFAFAPNQPTAFRPYGYPWLLAGISTLFGSSIAAVQGVQLLLIGVSVVWFYLWTKPLLGTAPALLSALMISFHPVWLYLPALLVPETAALCTTTALLYFAWQLVETRPPLSAVGVVIAAALSVWLRPELLLLIGLLPVSYIIYKRQWNVPAQNLLIASLIAILIATLPLAIRNQRVLGTPTPTSTSGGITFWGGNNAHATGGWVYPSPDHWIQPPPPPNDIRGWANLTEIESQNRFYQAAWDWIVTHPQEALALLPAKLARSWSLSYGDIDKPSPLPVYVAWVHTLLGLLASAGILLLFRHQSPLLWILLPPILAWLTKTLLFYGSARQTAPVLPIVFLFASLPLTLAAGRKLEDSP